MLRGRIDLLWHWCEEVEVRMHLEGKAAIY